MGYADTMRIMGNINCGLASFGTFMNRLNDGVNPCAAGAELSTNMVNGVARNQIAYEMQRHGNPVGNSINLYAGYGTPEANAFGTYALFSANLNPWMCFRMYNCCYGPMMPRPMMPMYGPYMGMGYMTPYACTGGFFC